MRDKNLLEQPLKYTCYNIDPHIHGINLTFQQYEYYLEQEKIADVLIKFLNDNGFKVTTENNWLSIEKNNNITLYEPYEGGKLNEISVNKSN